MSATIPGSFEELSKNWSRFGLLFAKNHGVNQHIRFLPIQDHALLGWHQDIAQYQKI